MSRLRSILFDSRTLSLIGIAALAALFFLGAQTLELALYWAALASGVLLLTWLATWLWRRRQARRAADRLDAVLDEQAARAEARAASARQPEIAALRQRLNGAIRTIRSSRLGERSGRAALYELPWYMLIGNPAAGKSSAVVNSGLTFPFADQHGSVIQGVGGTRNCDWFFTTEGILLDTAGRYAIHEEDRSEWLGFLDLLRRHRPRAPINGIVVAASIAELAANPPEFAITLAKKLRQRVQELTERLEVFAPVYLMFTKADLITGFSEFFQDADGNERNRVWGASLPFDPQRGNDAIERFERHFDELYQGLREMSVAQMSIARGTTMPPGLLAFPLEFAALKPALRAFVATLFEDNPFQFKPVFRGFYFTSALQEGETRSNAEARIEQRFGLTGAGLQNTRVASRHGFFLKDLFARVVFADRNLVRRQTSRRKQRLRLAAFALSMALLGTALAGWTWSYLGNRQLLANVEADLDKAVDLQRGRDDLQSRLEALEILQDRLEQLERFGHERPLAVGLGLYQGKRIEARLRREYFSGIEIVLLEPVSRNLEAFLEEVNRSPEALSAQDAGAPQRPAPALAPMPYREASPRRVDDAYNALKTYLMLGAPEHAELGHLNDQLTRFWRGWLDDNRGTMPREQMIRLAGRLLSFHLSHAADADWPRIRPNLAIVDLTRQNLRKVVRGMPAQERVYAQIKARASTRFAPVTVASIVGKDGAGLVSGSQAVSGAFTLRAWREHVEPQIRRAANESLQSADWVLDISSRDDLSLEGSPEQIRKQLVASYKTDYANAWKGFMQGIAITPFENFDDAVERINTLGDPQRSPIVALLRSIDEQTSWDSPGKFNAGLERGRQGFVEWFKRSVLRLAPSRVEVDVNLATPPAAVQMGPVGEAFAGISRLTMQRDSGPALLDTYLKQLSALRGRLNQLRNQGDPGPGARQLMQQTIGGGGSELAATLRFVDEQMLAGMNDAQRVVVRPLLVRPLLQTFNALVEPTETELNKIWQAQVREPFIRNLAAKYPFSAGARIEATPAEIGKIFGPQGAIASYLDTAVGPLVIRRGDLVTPRTWGDLGVRLNPAFVTGVGPWVAPLAGGADAREGKAGGTSGKTVFQLQPRPVPGTAEYTVEIDGQKLRYRNTPPQWANFVWPNEGGTPGARITATTFAGKTVEVVNLPGRFGLERLISGARRKRLPDGSFEMSWSAESLTVSLALRIISSPESRANDEQTPTRPGLGGARLPERIAGPKLDPRQLARSEVGQ